MANVDINPGLHVEQNEQNIAIFSQDVRPTRFRGVSAESLLVSEIKKDGDDFIVHNNEFCVQPKLRRISLTMPKSLFTNLKIDGSDKNQRIYFVIYRKQTFLQPYVKKSTDGTTVNKLNSWVISGSIKGAKITNMKDPIVTTYKPLESGIYEATACVFWDLSLNDDDGGWSKTGCVYKGTTDGIVTCHCFHLVNFAILMVGPRCNKFRGKFVSQFHNYLKRACRLENCRK